MRVGCWIVYVLCTIILVVDSETIFERKLLQRKPDYRDILDEHSKWDKEAASRRENGHLETLGFVTPWNNRGYDIVKWFRKFTMVSPVWYNIRRTGIAGYTLTGEHDVDKSWMKEVRGIDSNGKPIGRILPRFAVEGWDKQAYQELMTNLQAQDRLYDLLVEQVEKHDFDGMVLEMGIPQYFESLIAKLADKIHGMKGEKKLVVVISPNVSGYPSAETLFHPNIHIDYFALMSYDHNVLSKEGAPNAPIEWVEEQISHFVGNKPETARRKLLVGLNMYGTLFTTQSPRRPITGTEYLQLLQKYKPSLQWDAESEESYFEFVDDTMQEGEVWYPSLYSIKKRIDLVDDYDVGGVSLWEVGQGLEYFYELL